MKHSTVRQALRSELESRSYDVGGDTVGLRDDLYVRGSGEPALDMLTQSGLSVLFYEESEETVVFLELEQAVRLFKS